MRRTVMAEEVVGVTGVQELQNGTTELSHFELAREVSP
jgi:hypothetical protein